MTADELIKLALDADNVEDFQTSFKYYEQAAKLGSTYAMMEVSAMYALARGVAQDYEKSFIWARTAAESGSPKGMAMTARMYEMGIGVAQDIDAALKWYVEAANAGEEHAQQRLEILFSEGR